MGWKLAIAAAPLNGGTLEQSVARIYGKPKSLSPASESVEEALFPKKRESRFATTHGDFAWVLDWKLAEDVLAAPRSYAGGASDFFYLHSVVNAYGFARRENGAFVRVRVGDSDNGIISDEGEPSNAERAAVAAVAARGQDMEAWAAWCDPDHAYMAEHEDHTHDSMGEDVVFAVMHERLGVRLDMNDAEPVMAQTVFAVR